MVALLVAGLVIVALVGLILFGVYKIKPALFKVKAGLLKVFTLDIEIWSPEQRSLPRKPGVDDHPDPSTDAGSAGREDKTLQQ